MAKWPRKDREMMLKRSSVSSRYSLPFLFRLCFVVLSNSGLIWSCATLGQKFSKKESQRISLSHQQVLKDQSEAMERKERELINYFGESATLLIKDGFRFQKDSGLVGNSALLYYQSQGMALEKQKDIVTIASQAEKKYSLEKAQIKSTAKEKQKSKIWSFWWLLIVLPLIWFIRKISKFIK